MKVEGRVFLPSTERYILHAPKYRKGKGYAMSTARSPVRQFRLQHNMTQAQLANKAGVSQSTVAHVERIGTAPRIDTAVKIAQALGVDVVELIH